MRVITCNVNGLRSAYRKGFLDWMLLQDADVICLQELKAQPADLQMPCFHPDGYRLYTHCAEKKGYSGVGIYTRHVPQAVHQGLGWPCADQEGRYLQIDFEGLSIASIYMPSGTSGAHRQALKYEFMSKYYAQYLTQPVAQGRQMIVCGDWNIAHRKIDLKNWRSNQKNSGFLPEERAWLDQCFTEAQWVDAFRVLNAAEGEYTWWTYRSQARARNVGWRIDYQVITPGLKSKIKYVYIDREDVFSDHAPLIIDYDWTLVSASAA